VTRLSLVTPDRGVLTVGRDSHPEVFWATAGAMGLTGVITEATMRLREIETAHVRVDTERATDVDDCMGRMIETDDRYEYSVAWIDCLASGRDLGRSVLTRANHATLDGLPPELARRAREFAPRAWLSAPPWMPNGLLNGLTVRAFNTAWFRRAPRARREELQTITQFFHPLDGVLGWNRVYGSQGFVQYQLLVPNGAEDVVRRVLERLAAARSPSFLAVLKRFEHGNDGMLSFPAPGWTLALDVPAGRHGLAGLLDGLDRLVVDAGGRVYLTKDSRLAPALLPEMYPRLTAWREVRDGLDARGVMRSDMARRLDLTGRRIREGSNA